jgi:hypothetical protein
MSKKKAIARTPKKDAAERVARLMQPFHLPGDEEPPPAKPLAVEDLLAQLAQYLDKVASPEFGGLKFTESQKHQERIFGAGAALRVLWNWIAAHAENGSEAAQTKLFDIALGISGSFVACARQRLPGIVKKAELANVMSGFISRDKCTQDAMQNLCHDIGQGTKFPFPLEAPGAKGRKQKAKLSTAQHGLVQELFGYMEDHRRRIAHAAHFADFGSCDEAQLPPLLLRMMKLPPLSSETWKQWRDVGRLVIEEATSGNPARHPAFQPGGSFASLGMPATQARRHEIALWKRLAEAWELRAQEMARLPAESPHRKPYERR